MKKGSREMENSPLTGAGVPENRTKADEKVTNFVTFFT